MKNLILFLCLVLGISPLVAQSNISDSRALELVFMTTCTLPSHTQAERNTHAAHLHRYRFGDEKGVATLLQEHCQKYQSLIDRHNQEIRAEWKAAVKSKHDYNPSLDTEFILSVAAQVNATADKLKTAYPADYERFIAIVQDEKTSNMHHYEDTAMMPGQLATGVHVHPAPRVNATQALGSYSDYGYTVYDSFGTNGYDGWYSMAIVGASQNSYYCTWDPYHGQWQPPPCPNVYHTPSVSMTVWGGAPTPDNENFTIYGQSLLPDEYMSWSVSNSPAGWNFYGPSKPRLTIRGVIGLTCTLAGVLINWPRAPSFTEAYTKGYVPANNIPFPTPCPGQSWCSARTTPPYHEFKQLIPVTPSACSVPYWDAYQQYVSYSRGPWTEYGKGVALASNSFEKGECDTIYSMPVP